MDIQKLKTFFMWCTIINGVLLFLGIIGYMFSPDLWYSVQSKLFHLPEENLKMVIYFLFGLFKICWLIFNAVPYAALLIAAKE